MQTAPCPPDTPAPLATEITAIRREIARLQRREAALLADLAPPGQRPGWPMQRLRQAMGDRISTSPPSRTAV